MKTIQIDRKALKAASRFAGVKDVRYYLNGVYVECNGPETRIIGCDGHTMAVHRATDNDRMNFGLVTFIIPNDAVKAMLAWKTPKGSHIVDAVSLTVPDDGIGECRAEFYGSAVVFRPIDGKFPDYRRVLPLTVSGETAQYNPEYLCRALDAARDLRGKNRVFSSGIAHNGSGSGVIRIDENMFAVIMPTRLDAPAADEFAWAREQMATIEPLQAVA